MAKEEEKLLDNEKYIKKADRHVIVSTSQHKADRHIRVRMRMRVTVRYFGVAIDCRFFTTFSSKRYKGTHHQRT